MSEQSWGFLWYIHKNVFSSMLVFSDRNPGLCIAASLLSSLIFKYP